MTSFAQHIPALLVVVPLAGAAVTFATSRRVDRAVTLVTAASVAVLAILMTRAVFSEGPWRYHVGGWGAPLGIELVADGVSTLFVLLTAVVGTCVSIYATGYFGSSDDETYGHGLFWTLWLFMWTSLNALFLAADVFNVYVCLELVGISAVALVALKGDAASLRASSRYLFASMLGAMTYLLGVSIVYSSTGTLDISMLSEAISESSTASTGIALMIAALVLKTALVPAHFWLPPAHAAALTPVSAALSGLVVKGSYAALLRLMLVAVPASSLPGVDVILAALGAFAIVWGSVQALMQARIKPFVAYSTVAQIGYLFIVFPLVRTRPDVAHVALTGALLHAASHGLAKAALFLAAGSLEQRFARSEICAMAGAARATPALAMSVALAGVTMMGLPPSGGFGAKWLLVSASIASGQWWWAVVLAAGGLLAAAYMFKVLGIFMASASSSVSEASVCDRARLEWLPLGMAACAAVLVFASPAIGTLAASSEGILRGWVMP